MNDYGMSDLFKKGFEFQQGLLKSWMDAMSGAANAAAKPAEEAASNPLAAITKTYQDMFANWQSQFQNSPFMKSYPWTYNFFNTGNTPFDISNKMMNSGKTFMDLMGIWQKLTGKDPFATRDQIVAFIEENRAAFERVSDDILTPFIPESLRPIMSQARSLVKQAEGMGKDFFRPWAEITQKSLEEIPNILKGDNNAYMSLYKAMTEAYEQSFGKALSTAGVGLTREQNEEIMSQFDSFFRLLMASSEVFSLISEVSKDNMVAVIEAYQDMAKKDSAPKSARDFYNLWMKINEDAFEKVFGTPQFAQIFAEFAKRACEFKMRNDAVMEKMLSWAPFPKNSEMKNLYKTVYDLRKSDYANTEEIRALREEVDALKKELSSAAGRKSAK